MIDVTAAERISVVSFRVCRDRVGVANAEPVLRVDRWCLPKFVGRGSSSRCCYFAIEMVQYHATRESFDATCASRRGDKFMNYIT